MAVELKIDNVSKQYRKDIWGLHDFSLTLTPGVLGLLGPNGAGKSTLMRILATITKPTGGKVTWNGTEVAKDPNTVRRVLGYLPQDFGVYPNLTPQEFLEYIAAAKQVVGKVARDRIDGLLQLVNLTDARNRPLGGFSGGMKQRVGIAAALLNDPQLLIVDEPTAGLDPEERVRFRNLLSDMSGDRIVILSTHIVSDVEAVATEIALIRSGSLLGHASPEKLLQSLDGKVWEAVISSDHLADFKKQWLVSGTMRRSDGVRVRVVSDTRPTPDAQAVPPNLEDAYLYFVSGSSRKIAA
jgi:ABC-2 type transport system ATP-binding protein